MYRGAFEGVDVVISMHAGLGNDGTITILGSHNGFTSKNVTFKGRSAHAAADPENGVNALYMANSALNGIKRFKGDLPGFGHGPGASHHNKGRYGCECHPGGGMH